jgi:hypothetical protein
MGMGMGMPNPMMAMQQQVFSSMDDVVTNSHMNALMACGVWAAHVSYTMIVSTQMRRHMCVRAHFFLRNV